MAFEYQTVALATLGKNVFNTIAKLIDDNKPSGWTVLSSFPEVSPTFPCIVIDPSKAKPEIVGLDKDSYLVENIEILIEFYALSKDGKEKIDEGRDNVRNTILTNQSTLDTYGLYLKKDPFDDSNVDNFITGREKLNTAGCILRMGKK